MTTWLDHLGDVDVADFPALTGKAVPVDPMTKSLVRPLLDAAFGDGDAQVAHDVAIAHGAKCSCAGTKSKAVTKTTRDALVKARARARKLNFDVATGIVEATDGDPKPKHHRR